MTLDSGVEGKKCRTKDKHLLINLFSLAGHGIFFICIDDQNVESVD